MPIATPELRAEMERRFGSIDCTPIIAWLERRGYKLRADYHWDAPAEHAMSPEEHSALLFLLQEWDFGWIVADLVKDGAVKTCLFCGEPLVLMRPNAVYCTVRCQQAAHCRRKSERERAARKAAKTRRSAS